MARKSFPWTTALAAGGLALGVAGFAASVAGRTSAATASRIAVPRRIALIGDSYAVGLGPELAKLLPAIRWEGHESTNVAEWADHAPVCMRANKIVGHTYGGNAGPSCGDWLTAYQPNLTLVALGVNDGNAPVSANYHTLVSALHGIGSKVVWIEPPARVSASAVRGVIRSLGVETVPGVDVPLAADGLHPASYAPWAKRIAQAIS